MPAFLVLELRMKLDKYVNWMEAKEASLYNGLLGVPIACNNS